MKKLKSLACILLLAAAFAGCKKDNAGPANNKKLVSEIATTYGNGQRSIIKYLYDEQKRLINSGLNGGDSKISYNTGGLSESVEFEGYKALMDVNLDNGRINTLHYRLQQGITDEQFLSTFSYDSKNRLIHINAIQLDLEPGYAWIHNYSYTWDDDDNLIQWKDEFSRNPDGQIETTYTVKYSGFSNKNVNTLKASDFGFDYFGTASYPGNFTPSTSGDTEGYLPPAYAGKLLPDHVDENGILYDITYQKNAQGLITRIDKKGPSTGYNSVYDIAYQ